MRRILITGTAGFIGYHLAEQMLQAGWQVQGYDALTPYYDLRLKQARHDRLAAHPAFRAEIAALEDGSTFDRVCDAFRPDVIVHLAAQAGVRYSLENPRAYIDANLIGTFNVLETARRIGVGHLLMASSSSVYGANAKVPFGEGDPTATPLSLYAATKAANEAMGHSYAHLWDLPITMFRFFTVYGPWGRPDMALYKFVEAIQSDRPIDIYNHGEMYRDFTYVTDLVRAIGLLVDCVPVRPADPSQIEAGDSLSPVAPFRVVNIGNSDRVRLLDFVEAIEESLGRKAKRNLMPMQKGDVPATWADATLLQRLTGYRPQTDYRQGVAQFVDWYLTYRRANP